MLLKNILFKTFGYYCHITSPGAFWPRLEVWVAFTPRVVKKKALPSLHYFF